MHQQGFASSTRRIPIRVVTKMSCRFVDPVRTSVITLIRNDSVLFVAPVLSYSLIGRALGMYITIKILVLVDHSNSIWLKDKR